MHRKITTAQGAGSAFGVRRSRGQIAAQSQQDLNLTTQHRLNGLYGVMARFASRREVKMLLQAVEQCLADLILISHCVFV
ncbi:hypothetical protein D3C86_1988380 [compost metagenome]